MKGIEKITARIQSDGSAETSQILREAGEKAKDVLAGYRAKAEAEAASAAAAGKEAAKRHAERLESSAHMEAKKQFLAAKQECLDAAFVRAQKELLSLPDDQYAGLLAKMACRASKSGREEILLNEKDRKRVGEQVVAKANEMLRRKGKLTLSEETREMEGGLTLKDGSVEVNCAFETELRVLRENMAAEIAAILFA
ncbi:MAG: V-type ATP synthase subunit E [Oscillospiraceae bacterium]|nr:V-type ATP synthase subunit E [Oscillospiraceae bacterium]